MSDPVADALIRIKNGYLAHKDEVELPSSKLIKAICGVLKNEGFIIDWKEEKDLKNKTLTHIKTVLRYQDKRPVLTDVKRVSKPGLRVYKDKKSLPFVLNGLGIAIVSTPKGVMTDKQARKEGVGGEVMALVW